MASIPAFRHGERSWQVEGKNVQYLDAWSYTEWFNLLGTPAVAVPVGKSPEGLPIGVQIVARPWQEEIVLSVAAALEEQCGGWHAPQSSKDCHGRFGGRPFRTSQHSDLLYFYLTLAISTLLCACVALAAAAIFAATTEKAATSPANSSRKPRA